MADYNDSDVAEFERRLWDAADQLSANFPLRPNEYSAPVLGLIAKVRKPTAAQLALRVDTVLEMICRGHTRVQIHSVCAEKWGVDWRTADRYVSRAREERAKEVGHDSQTHIAEAYAFFKSI